MNLPILHYCYGMTWELWPICQRSDNLVFIQFDFLMAFVHEISYLLCMKMEAMWGSQEVGWLSSGRAAD